MKIRECLPTITRAVSAIAAAGVISMNAHAQCNIYMNSSQQAIDGFGFSSAWCGTLTSAKNSSAYGTLGFSLLRIQIDPNGNWNEETANAAAAHAGGAKVLGSSWSAPGSWTTAGGAYSGSLLPEHYADYANWLKSAVSSHNLDWVSPANEPDLGWMSWTSDQLKSWIGQYGGSLGKPLLSPESCGFSDDYGDPILDDSAAGPNVSIYGGHLYGASPSVHQDALNKGKHVWVTEKYFDGSETDMSVCVSFAQEVSDSLNDQMSAYIYWSGLIGDDGSIYKNGYTLGQFAKWIRPGSTRVSSDYNPQTGVSVTAYKVNGGTVIVALNANTYSVSQQFVIQNGNAATMEGYRTSSSQGMADIGSFNVSSGSFTANLPAQSITTFVQTSNFTGSTYKIISLNSGKAMCPYGGGTANGTQMHQGATVELCGRRQPEVRLQRDGQWLL
jgi:glucuronoarabinoxylan endo-1,4-beta-xylanase